MSPLYPAKRKPINKESQTKKSRAWFYAEQKAALKRRCGGKCEGCGVSVLEQGADSHHIFGREGSGAGLGYPWCHLVDNLAVLDRHCHDGVTDGTDRELDTRLKRAALMRMCERFDVVPLGHDWGTDEIATAPAEDLPGLARHIVILAAELGWRERLLGEEG